MPCKPMSDFVLDSRLQADTSPVASLLLCDVRLMDDARWPWLVLVPRRAGAVELLDLDTAARQQLMVEVADCAEALRASVPCDKLNVATLGNVVAQLHVHVIARRHGDAAWPRPVWGVGSAETYADHAREELHRALLQRLLP